VALSQLPLTVNGKLDYKALPPVQLPPVAAQELPHSASEKAVAALWRQVLGREHIGLRENFFQIGGHSLKVIRLHQLLNEVYPNVVEVHAIFSNPTIKKLASIIDARTEARTETIKEKTLRRVEF
jgi:surfactin family lipopeptide synthetase A/fengycin family lipopeptide synthetase D